MIDKITTVSKRKLADHCMSERTRRSVVRSAIQLLAAVLTVSGSSVVRTSAKQAGAPTVLQVDHVIVRTGDPKALQEFFVEVLQLPVAWPLMRPRAGVTTGGVSFGNVNVEAIQFSGQKDDRPRLVGFGFEAAPLKECLTELDRRGITYGQLRTVVSTAPNGSRNTLWTNVTLTQFSDSDSPADATIHIVVTEYSPTYMNVAERRARLRAELITKDGGPLGVEGVKELVIGARDVEAARALWQKLLDPTRASSSEAWQVGSGPSIRLLPAQSNSVQALVIRVASLERAKAFLREKQLLGIDSAEEVTIEPSKLHGLNIRLVEAQ
jgi:catechol 2,3-dioxygenase-like lactoylglutathione lyase family enzyme